MTSTFEGMVELTAPNAEAARGFYTAVLGADQALDEDGELRFVVVRDGAALLAVVQAPQVIVSSGEGVATWSEPMPTFQVEDPSAAARRAEDLGAAVDGSQVTDPQGASFELAGA